ncbi:hypothetical protein HNY73_010806 [Argiope bruennichi]|uniref:Mutator-like transposase domain-containing protein n=1 Tax=Argiope bruennichi TaxID=94029 RepID=A0A8T0F263_ARGBR|nr:hypothetical protein HNY73_010806 [Argiope bruennichi]
MKLKSNHAPPLEDPPGLDLPPAKDPRLHKLQHRTKFPLEPQTSSTPANLPTQNTSLIMDLAVFLLGGGIKSLVFKQPRGLHKSSHHLGAPVLLGNLLFAQRVEDPMHEWYVESRPDAVLIGVGNRHNQTTLARFRSGHTHVQCHPMGNKVYPLCPKCNATQAAAAHILACIEIIWSEKPDSRKMPVNTAAVSSIMATGGGYLNLEYIPSMTSCTFQKDHDRISAAWEETATKEMHDAAMEEKRLTIEATEIDSDGIPLSTVVADGCWAKRSYRTNYSSLSGAIIELPVPCEARSVMRFLSSRNLSAADIHHHICEVNGATTMSENKVPKRTRDSKAGRDNVRDESCFGRSSDHRRYGGCR